MMYVIGPGHGGPAIAANTWLEGSYSDTYPDVPRTSRDGRLFRQFSFPGGIPSHVAPELPGSIHEGGELGYSLSHAYGAVLDNPDLVVACVVGDGEAETGPLAASWHSNKFLDPAHRRRGAADPAPERLQDRQPDDPGPDRRRRARPRSCEGYGYRPYLVEGDDPELVHQASPRRSTRSSTRSPRSRPRPAPTGRTARALADDRPAHAEGVDRSARGRRRTGRGDLAGPPGAAVRRTNVSL